VLSGETFFFELNLFEIRSPPMAHLVRAFDQLVREGLGPGRGRANLVEVSHMGERFYDGQVYDGEILLLTQFPSPLELSLDHPAAPEVERLTIRFLTPTELKAEHGLAERPDFGILASRIRDRLSTLRELYGDGPLAIDFRAFGERASRVQMTSCRIEHVGLARRSSRTGQIHSIGGFIGEADYEGNLTEFLPYLEAAKWTGVGRQTVWGKGTIDVAATP